jgi:hypothetical protein
MQCPGRHAGGQVFCNTPEESRYMLNKSVEPGFFVLTHGVKG